MAESLDQIFVSLKHWLLGFVPAGDVQQLASAILSLLPILIVFPTLFAITTLKLR